jgi:short-subunit dehydrogenase
MTSRIIIFGATSAIAHATARLWAARGAHLFLVGRNALKLQSVEDDLRARAAPGAIIASAQADLDKLSDHPALIGTAVAALGGDADVVLIAHGNLPDQARCQADVQEMLSQLNTNGLSVISLCTLLANRFEAQGSGTLAVITSVAGDRGRQSNYAYGAAKGLVSRFLQGLRNRLTPHGVSVIDIRPGFVDTPMTAAIDKGGPLWAAPTKVASDIVRAVDRRRPVVYTPWFWRYILLIIVLIPERVFNRLKL